MCVFNCCSWLCEVSLTLKRDRCNAFVQVLHVTVVFKHGSVLSVVTVTWHLPPTEAAPDKDVVPLWNYFCWPRAGSLCVKTG